MSPSLPRTVPAVYLRGGTSKAVFFHERDLPPPGQLRDDFMIRMMGSPDASQIDGMGGAKIVTSKAAIIRPSQREDADVDYTFVQVGLGESTVSYDGNCGNISSGVGPFAINEGLLDSDVWSEGKRVVRIYNTGMDAILITHVPVDAKTGRAQEKGDFQISGISTPGAPIHMDYSKTAKPSILLPTGNAVDNLECTFGTVGVTYCSVANPIVIAKATDLDAKGDEMPPQLDANTTLLARIREVRGRIAQKVGKCDDWTKVDEQSPMLPMVALVSPATASNCSIQSRLFLDNHCHPSMAGTGGVCTAASAFIPGSVTNQVRSQSAPDADSFVIQHPAGRLPITVSVDNGGGKQLPTFSVLGFARTARYLMKGAVFVPDDLADSWVQPVTEPEATHPKIQRQPEASQDQKATNPPKQPQDVTKRMVEFVQATKYADLSAEAKTRVRQCLLDYLGVGVMGAKVSESSPAFTQAIASICKDFPGKAVVFNSSQRYPAQYAALLNGAFAHSLDFDDTHSGGILHVAVSVISAALAESESHPDLTFERMIVAIAVGYEVAVRISMSLGVSSWHRGFHNTSIAGIFGAVAAVFKLREVDSETLTNGFGLTCSFASGSMQYLENGAWNKRLHPAKAAHDAFLILAFAQANVLGAAQPIEGKLGLIAAHTDGVPSAVDVSDLGKRWEMANTGLKPYPGCRVTHCAVEIAAQLGEAGKGRNVDSITIYMGPAGYPITGLPAPNKVHPKSVVDAQFSSYFQTAASYLHGDKLGWAVYDHIHDIAVNELTDKITIVEKPMPKNLSTSMTVRWKDGQEMEKTLVDPKWEEPQRPMQDAEVAQKFSTLATSVIGQDAAGKIVEFVTGSQDQTFAPLCALLSPEA